MVGSIIHTVAVIAPCITSKEIVEAAFGQTAPDSAVTDELGYNGIELSHRWTTQRPQLSHYPVTPSCLRWLPKVILIYVGRQLLVEDFPIKRSTLMRTDHLPAYYEHNPAREHDQPWETHTAPNLFASTVIGSKATCILLKSAPTGPAQAMNMLLPVARGSKVPSIPLMVGRS